MKLITINQPKILNDNSQVYLTADGNVTTKQHWNMQSWLRHKMLQAYQTLVTGCEQQTFDRLRRRTFTCTLDDFDVVH